MASLAKPRKRVWGKSRESTNHVILESMELGNQYTSFVTTNNNESDTCKSSEEKKLKTSTVDLQHPEMLSTNQLTSLLSHYKVPIPVYADGSPSRERLLYMYRKHVLPRPQRLRQHLRRQKFSSSASSRVTSVAMDMTRGCEHEMEWVGGEGEEKWEEPILQGSRKRTSSTNNSDTSCLPSSKKPVTIATKSPPPFTPRKLLKRPTLNHTHPSDHTVKINKIT